MVAPMERSTIVAFVGVVVLGGVNGVSISITNQEVPPLWGATLRFGAAALLLFGLTAARQIDLPRGPALVGSLLYGLLYFGVGFGLIHWALVDAPPGLTQVILAVVPLAALLLAVAHRVERFRWQGIGGAVLALAGVVVVFGDPIGGAVPIPSLLAVLGGAVAIAEGSVAVKRFPGSHPVAGNAVAMAVGAGLILVVSLLAGEPPLVPDTIRAWAALTYLVVVGSVVVFVLFLYVIARWTASATSYVWPLLPLVAVPFSALVLAEPVTPLLLAGGLLVVAGVYLGAFAPSIPRPAWLSG